MSAGLEGVVAADTALSSIDGERGMLVYRGYAIDDLAQHATFEEIVHLLLEGELPTRTELDDTRGRLADRSQLPDHAIEALRLLPRGTSPMEALRTGVSVLGSAVPTGGAPAETKDAAYTVIARIPSLIGAFHRLRSGAEPLAADPGGTLAGNLVRGMLGTAPDPDTEAAMDCALVLHAEHTLNASTFAARVAAGTGSDLYSAITAAIGTLRGPLHGGANEQVARMLAQIDSVGDVEDAIDGKLARKERVMGFGHRVYRTEDPRGPHLQAWARKMAERNGMVDLFEKAERVQQVVLDRKGLFVNVDFYSAPLYTAIGIPRDVFTPLFAASRAAGWCAHVVEQQANNRLIRPTANYVGEWRRDWQPLDQRG